MQQDEDHGLQQEQQKQREEQTINDPGMGPNVSKDKAGELEEEESAGAALMPQPIKAGGVLAVLEAGEVGGLRNQAGHRDV